jgi:putative DNA primase/helicase
MNIAQATTGRWPGILSHYGLGDYLSGKHGPCPICGGKDRFRFTNYQGRGGWVCNQCHERPGDGMDLLQAVTGKPFAELAREIEGFCGRVVEQAVQIRDPLPALERVGKYAKPLTGADPASQYLAGRGLQIRPQSIRWLSKQQYFKDRDQAFDAMVARIADTQGRRKSYQITYLSNGKKAPVDVPRYTMPPEGTISGAGVYLGPVAPHMLVGEGVESTLAGMQLFGLPGIAALSANGMQSLILPDGVEQVTVLADNDPSFTGHAAAYALAKRLHRDGIKVAVQVAPDIGTDFADLVA